MAIVLEFPVDDAGFDGGEEAGWLYWERGDDGAHGYAGVGSLTRYGAETSYLGFFDPLRRLFRRRGGPRGNRARP